jgi:hypothetical protein
MPASLGWPLVKEMPERNKRNDPHRGHPLQERPEGECPRNGELAQVADGVRERSDDDRDTDGREPARDARLEI